RDVAPLARIAGAGFLRCCSSGALCRLSFADGSAGTCSSAECQNSRLLHRELVCTTSTVENVLFQPKRLTAASARFWPNSYANCEGRASTDVALEGITLMPARVHQTCVRTHPRTRNTAYCTRSRCGSARKGHLQCPRPPADKAALPDAGRL